MARTAEDVLRVVRSRKVTCPACGGQRWQAITEPVIVTNADGTGRRPLLSLVCKSCGYVTLFQQNVPEVYEAGQRSAS